MLWAEIVDRIFTSSTLGKDVNFPLITKFENKQVSELFICKSNTELKCELTH